MLCDAVREDEIFEAFFLYASLHGLSTDEREIRDRITSYLHNSPDSMIDDAVLAFAEDRIVAPPDVVLPRWGKSRIYELDETPQREWRHRVCDSWFDNGCEFYGDDRDPRLYHFWTQFVLQIPWPRISAGVGVGTRLQLQIKEAAVTVSHRSLGAFGELPHTLAHELTNLAPRELRYLALVDTIDDSGGDVSCKLMTTVAAPDIELTQVIDYAARAFQALRAKC